MVTQYKCPSCGANMTFDSKTGMLQCDSCGRSDHIENMETHNKSDQGNIVHETEETWDQVHDHDTFQHTETNEYYCNSCGALIFTDANTSATTCSFCGAPVMLTERLSGTYAPAKVIPFEISKEEATQSFKKWCRKGLLFPSDFKVADRIKSITGMYIPFFLYDISSNAELNASCTRVRNFTKGDYIYTETSFYNVYRNADLKYLKIPVDASEKMNDKLMDQLEPFSYENLKDFKLPYLSGYIAEKYDYTDKELFPRVRSRVESYADEYLRSTIKGYTTTRVNYERVDVQPSDTFYTLLPIWMVCYDYKHSEHTFAMNGQTGKIVGKPPISKLKVLLFFLGIWVGTTLLQWIIELIITGGVF